MNNIVKTLVALAATMTLTAPANAVDHTAKRVLDLHVDATRPCAFFRLEGVAEADPVTPGSMWFAVPRAHAGYTELFAMLLTAKAANLPVTIKTNGTSSTACSTVPNVDVVWIV